VRTDAELDRAVDAIRSGGIVVYPTETVYGLGADARSRHALERLFALKGRDAGIGVSVLVGDLAAARDLIGDEPPAEAHALARAFWPGPLTLVLPARAERRSSARRPRRRRRTALLGRRHGPRVARAVRSAADLDVRESFRARARAHGRGSTRLLRRACRCVRRRRSRATTRTSPRWLSFRRGERT
jgi:hypothetical protein